METQPVENIPQQKTQSTEITKQIKAGYDQHTNPLELLFSCLLKDFLSLLRKKEMVVCVCFWF